MTGRRDERPDQPGECDGLGDTETYYRDFYSRLPCGSATGIVARLAHSSMERPFPPDTRFSHILEVGAGGGLHFDFVRHAFDTYEMSDISPLGLESAQARVGMQPGVSYRAADAQSLPHDDDVADRLIATCVLLHLEKPESALQEWRRVTRAGGIVTIYVPNEPGLLTRLGRGLTTKRAAVRAGYAGFDLMMAREHINHGWGLEQLVRYVFRHDELRIVTWPIPRSPLSARVFTVYHATLTAPYGR